MVDELEAAPRGLAVENRRPMLRVPPTRIATVQVAVEVVALEALAHHRASRE